MLVRLAEVKRHLNYGHTASPCTPRLQTPDKEATMSVSVPKYFPPGTQFAKFEGIPISHDADLNLIAWDVPGGRRFFNRNFLNESCWPDSGPISEAEFRALAKRY